MTTTTGLERLRPHYFKMSSHLPTDEALEKEDRIDEISKKKKKNIPPIPHLLQAQQAPALPYAKVVGRPGTGSYPAPSPDPTTHEAQMFFFENVHDSMFLIILLLFYIPVFPVLYQCNVKCCQRFILLFS